jgi:hypothetical protein
MLAGLLALATLIMTLFPRTALARWLHRHLVELPVARATRVGRADILLLLILIVGGQALVMAGSLDLAFLYAADLSLYLDAAIAVSAVAAAASLRSRWSSVRAVLPLMRSRRPTRLRPQGRPRRRRSRALPAPRGRNDDESHPGRDHGGVRARGGPAAFPAPGAGRPAATTRCAGGCGTPRAPRRIAASW